MKGKLLVGIAVCCFLVVKVTVAHAQHFFPDTTFAVNGIDTFGGDISTGVIHRPGFVLPTLDNKIVLAGCVYYATSMELMRLKYSGAFDSTFSDTGVVRVTRSYIQDPPSATALYDTSKVIMATDHLNLNTGQTEFAVYDFNGDGTLNTNFAGGVAYVNISTYSTPTACGAQQDGKIVVMGRTQDANTGYDIYGLVRLLPAGVLDNTYGNGGAVICPYPIMDTPIVNQVPTANIPRAGYMQSDDKFVVVGMFVDSPQKYPYYQAFAVRHNSNGTPDMTFGEANGVTLIKDTGADFETYALGTDSAGNYYVFTAFRRTAPPYTDSNYAVIKLDHNGHRVAGYGANGIAYLWLNVATTTAMAVQKDGRVIIPAINRTPQAGDSFVVYRLDPAGNFDTSFGPGGRFSWQRPGHLHDVCVNAGVQQDGKILLAGYDSLSATSMCLRITNKKHSPLSVARAAGPAFTGCLYPNPSSGKAFHIHYINGGQAKKYTLSVYDETGRLAGMQHGNLSAGYGDIDYHLPPGTPAGIYNISLSNEDGGQQVYRAVCY